MRKHLWLMSAATALLAAPAAGQENVANTSVANVATTTDLNAANAAAPVTDPTAVPPADATAPPFLPADNVQAPTEEDDDDADIPWGLIGLVGLIGLLGRRRRKAD